MCATTSCVHVQQRNGECSVVMYVFGLRCVVDVEHLGETHLTLGRHVLLLLYPLPQLIADVSAAAAVPASAFADVSAAAAA